MTIEIIIERLIKQIADCKENNWFPDDSSKQEGYIEALEEMLKFIADPRIIS
jgi:hypothetical protein